MAMKANPAADDAPRRMMTEPQVLQVIPISRTTLHRMEKAGKFPRATYISPNRKCWFADEVSAWQIAVDERNPNRGRGKGRRRQRPQVAAVTTARHRTAK